MKVKPPISAIILILLALSLFACAPQESSCSLQSSNLPSSSLASASLSSTFSQNSSASVSRPVIPFAEVTESDVPCQDQIYAKEDTEEFAKVYDEKEKEPQKNWDVLLDNDLPLTVLLKNQPLVGTDETWLCSSLLCDNYTGGSFLSIATVYGMTEIDASFARKTGEFYNSTYSPAIKGERMYTVLESEMGGYVYCFFDYYPSLYPKEYSTHMKAFVYVPEKLEYADFSQLKVGDSIDKVIDISAVTIYTKKSCIPFSIFLLKDGVLYIRYDESQNIAFIYYGSDFKMSNPNDGNYEETADYMSPDWRLYDFTILPQDYPQ